MFEQLAAAETSGATPEEKRKLEEQAAEKVRFFPPYRFERGLTLSCRDCKPYSRLDTPMARARTRLRVCPGHEARDRVDFARDV